MAFDSSKRDIFRVFSHSSFFALTVTPEEWLQLEVVLRKGQRLLDRGPYTRTGAWTDFFSQARVFVFVLLTG